MTAPRALLLTCLTVLFIFGCSSRHPSDESLLTNFRSHRTEFDQLLEMFQADKGLGRVAHDFTRPEKPEEVGVSAERIAQYRRLFKQLGLKAGIEGYDPKEMVSFYASTMGLSISGSSKGYAYLTVPPKLLVSGLDGYRRADGRSFTAFRHIEGNWYLYLDYED